MKVFDQIEAWGNYLIEWVLYVAKCCKAVLGTISHLRNSWPDRPSVPKPAKSTNSDKESPVTSGPVSTDGEVLDSGVRV